MKDKLLELKRKLGMLLRYTEENTYELRSLFSTYELLVTEHKEGQSYHTIASIGASELSSYISVFMDHKINPSKRKEAYRVVYNFLEDVLQ